MAESRAGAAGDQPFWHSSQSFSTTPRRGGILEAGLEGTDLQYPTGFSCDVCDGIAVVDIDDGDRYLCAAHATDPQVAVDLTGDDPLVSVEIAGTSAPNVIMMGGRVPEPVASIVDPDVQRLLDDVVIGLRGIRRRLESPPPRRAPSPATTGAPEHVCR